MNSGGTDSWTGACAVVDGRRVAVDTIDSRSGSERGEAAGERAGGAGRGDVRGVPARVQVSRSRGLHASRDLHVRGDELGVEQAARHRVDQLVGQRDFALARDQLHEGRSPEALNEPAIAVFPDRGTRRAGAEPDQRARRRGGRPSLAGTSMTWIPSLASAVEYPRRPSGIEPDKYHLPCRCLVTHLTAANDDRPIATHRPLPIALLDRSRSRQ